MRKLKATKKLDFNWPERTYLIEHKNRLYEIHFYNVYVYVRDITDAYVPGKICPKLSLDYYKDKDNPSNVYNLFFNKESDLHEILQATTDQKVPEKDKYKEYKAYAVNHREYNKSMLFFPIYNMERIKPLKKYPRKWTLPLVIRCLVNEQYYSFECNGIYTDDYAWDNQNNCFRGPKNKESVLNLCKDIVESPSGWRAWKDSKEEKVHLCCHSFNLNEFFPKIYVQKEAM